jgi:hypothetical protein
MDKVLSLLQQFKAADDKAIVRILAFKNDFKEKLEAEKRRLPFNINLLDEIHANENAQSRILSKLLHYTFDKNYILLKIFFDFLGYPFSALQLVEPKITAEKNRIDIRIRDNAYSIIIENKIWGAKDQERQIERYISIEKGFKYQEDEIYIIYLSLEGGSPDKTSITRERRKDFSARYKEINYRNHILIWLREHILSTGRRNR